MVLGRSCPLNESAMVELNLSVKGESDIAIEMGVCRAWTVGDMVYLSFPGYLLQGLQHDICSSAIADSSLNSSADKINDSHEPIFNVDDFGEQ